jgi:hypothetical protein
MTVRTSISSIHLFSSSRHPRPPVFTPGCNFIHGRVFTTSSAVILYPHGRGPCPCWCGPRSRGRKSHPHRPVTVSTWMRKKKLKKFPSARMLVLFARMLVLFARMLVLSTRTHEIFIFKFLFPSAWTRECVHVDTSLVRTDEEGKKIKIKIKIYLRLCGCRSRPRRRTYALTFSLGGWKCEWGLI